MLIGVKHEKNVRLLKPQVDLDLSFCNNSTKTLFLYGFQTLTWYIYREDETSFG